MLASRMRLCRPRKPGRAISTLANNPHIRVFRCADPPTRHLLTYLDASPPNPDLAVGTTSRLPPTPASFQENPRFLRILYDVLAQHAKDDAGLQSHAKALASPGGAVFGARRTLSHTGAGGASDQGGAGGAGIGGWVHLSDLRNPPDFGRIAWPEDILGSVEVDGQGNIVGSLQPSGTYRILTNEGILGLSDFLRGRLLERLQAESRQKN
ncbi:hypothetical protein P8C59_004728 [Phyllachora maydis]|uniref:Uncharacterized protein n=1 Tax=Phyllachora maydis TaxID=1825666 RepID=A0AAD9MCS2_9PEZI|nr:hypothetical protein P8C59_004728 [Phyllachora maydis]